MTGHFRRLTPVAPQDRIVDVMVENTTERPPELQGTRAADALTWRVCLVGLAVAVYLLLPMLPVYKAQRPNWVVHFPELANAFSHGRLDIEVADAPSHRSELIPAATGGGFYCPYPPLPAVLLMPFVAIWGTSLKLELICRGLSVVNVLLFDVCLCRMVPKLGLPALAQRARVLFGLLFAFGTIAWHNADMGGDWHFAHAAAVCAVLLALCEFFGRRRFWIIGIMAGAAILCRPTTALVALFFVLPPLRGKQWAQLGQWVIGPLAAIALLGWYNFARFGDAWDFGYERMVLRGEGLELMRMYGQFNQHFVLRNFYWFFLAPPWVGREGASFPWLGYDPHGLSLFIATPAAIFALAAIRRKWGEPIVRHVCFAIGACLIPLLMYFNTGFMQFGHRFAMDYLPLLMILIVMGMKAKPSRLGVGLIVASIVVQAWGILSVPIPLTRLPPWLSP